MKYEVIDTVDGSKMSHSPQSIKETSTTLFGSEEEAKEWMALKRLSGPRYVVREAS